MLSVSLAYRSGATHMMEESIIHMYKMNFPVCRCVCVSYSMFPYRPTLSCQQQIRVGDPSQGPSSPSSKISGIGWSPAAHADDLDSGPPAGPPQSLNPKWGQKIKPFLCMQPHSEKPGAEGKQRKVKSYGFGLTWGCSLCCCWTALCYNQRRGD